MSNVFGADCKAAMACHLESAGQTGLADMLQFLLPRQTLTAGLWAAFRFRIIAICKIPMETVFPQVFVC